MAIRLHFWVAAQTVTGSSHDIECACQNVPLDCGLFQGHRKEAFEINSHLALSSEQIASWADGGLSAVVLSHAHIDHSGNLPSLVKQGYRGPIYATAIDRRPLRTDAERQCPHSGRRRRVSQQTPWKESVRTELRTLATSS